MDKSLNRETYDRLKRDILTFALKPGESVSAAKLAERYEVSRTPAREALVKLESEGLVDIYPQSKTVISRINVHRVRQEWFIRKSLELGMVDPFIDLVTERDIDLMDSYNRELVKLMDLPRTSEAAYSYLSYDNDFHAVSYMVAGERLSAMIINNMMSHYNHLRMLIDLEDLFKKRTLSDHEQLIEYARRKDREKYRETLTHHLSHIVKDIDNMKEKYPDYFEE